MNRDTGQMSALRWRLPDDPLRTSAAITGVVGFVAVVSLALTVGAGLHLSAWYPAKAAASFAIVMAVAIGFLRGRHPFDSFGLPNQITTARALMVALIIGMVGEQVAPAAAWTAAAGALLATTLDGVDGWLARRAHKTSAFGARFDMEVDALLIQWLAILAWRHGKAGSWIVMSGLLRYLFVAAGWLWPWMRRELSPTLRGKALCIVQMVALILVIVPIVTPPASTSIAAVGLLALSYSFLVDILRLWRAAD